MAHLSLKFLGAFQVWLDGAPVTGFESNKVRAMLAYLAVEAGQPHHRDALAGLLWPEFPDRAALSNVRYALANLRKRLHDQAAQPPVLCVTPDTLQLNPEGSVTLDAVGLVLRGLRYARLARCPQVTGRLWNDAERRRLMGFHKYRSRPAQAARE